MLLPVNNVFLLSCARLQLLRSLLLLIVLSFDARCCETQRAVRVACVEWY